MTNTSDCNPFDVEHYSLWLMPEGELATTLAALISRLSSECSSPLFPPHITLLGELTGTREKLTARTRTLVTRLTPVELILGNVDYMDQYFRSIFVRIQESDSLLQANRVARKVFQRTKDPPFMPHLSLLYGNFALEKKESIIKDIGKRLDYRFRATDLYLYSTSGDPKGWQRLGKFPLCRNRN